MSKYHTVIFRRCKEDSAMWLVAIQADKRQLGKSEFTAAILHEDMLAIMTDFSPWELNSDEIHASISFEEIHGNDEEREEES